MIKVFEAFAGIGTQRMALRNLGIEHEVVAIAEIDKFAIASYEAIHGETVNFGDISKVKAEDVPDHDLFTYSFPCQDISVAGLGKGLGEGSGTRSGLLWECERIIESKKPKYLLMENVKNLVSKKFKPDFEKWLERLEDLGYTNYWQVLNAKDYGIPQNRERVFCVSILDDNQGYKFPEPFELELRLKDLLEDGVDEKFYLSQEQVERITFSSYNQNRSRIQEKEYSDTLCARDYKDPKCIKVGDFRYDEGLRIRKNGLSPCLTTKIGSTSISGNTLIIKNGTKKGYLEATEGDGIDLAYPESKTRRGRVQKEISQTIDTGDAKGVLIGASRGRNPENPSDRTVGAKTEQRLEINKNGTSNTLTSVQKDNLVVEPKIKKLGNIYPSGGQAGKVYDPNGISVTVTGQRVNSQGYLLTSDNLVVEPYRIRKLTPLECWRLMGCSDEDFHKAQKVNSNAQLYKQAGNAIVVNVLEAIFNKLFIDTESTGNNGNTFLREEQ